MPSLLRSAIALLHPAARVDPTFGARRPRHRESPDTVRAVARGDDGDVPGWVLVTLMTAGLVLAIWAVAGPALTELFTTAIARVTSFGG